MRSCPTSSAGRQLPLYQKSKGFVQILPERWKKVLLKPGWEAKVSTIKPKVYLLGNENWQVVDKTFDKMHCLGVFKFITEQIPFSFLVFVV